MGDREIKLWTAALRSGEYEQTKGILHEVDDGYCCLGIACELFLQDGGELVITEAVSSSRQVRLYDGSPSSLPEKVQTWLGLRESLGHYQLSISLAGHNDAGTSFVEIAQIIEDNLDTLLAKNVP